jgi:hypothetical protein
MIVDIFTLFLSKIREIPNYMTFQELFLQILKVIINLNWFTDVLFGF